MAGLVLDYSVALSWLMPDEHAAAGLLDRVTTERAIVPGIWPLEMANSLLTAERRNRISKSQRKAALQALAALPIEVDGETASHAWKTILDLADTHRLTAYDAAYLELAARRSLPLATFDRELSRAAEIVGIKVI